MLHTLRPQLTQEKYLDMLHEMKTEGYSLIFLEENGRTVSALGFQYMTMLYTGKFIYIDNLTSLPESQEKATPEYCWIMYLKRPAKKNTTVFTWTRAISISMRTGCT